MKNKNIKTRITAAILSAITVCSVGTMAIATASAATKTVSISTDITNENSVTLDKDLSTAKR